MTAIARPKLTYANVVATLALFLAMGGTAAAASGMINGSTIKNHTVTGEKLKNNTVTGTQVKESTLRTVPSASVAARALSLRPLVWHPITNLSNGYSDNSKLSVTHARPLGYAIDAQGIVHLRGVLTGGTAVNAVAFTLPAAASVPAGIDLSLPILCKSGHIGEIDIAGNQVLLYTTTSASAGDIENFASLEGITYPLGG